MDDKERLEEIKHLYDYVEIASDEEDGHNVRETLFGMFSEGHIRWLIKQAEQKMTK